MPDPKLSVILATDSYETIRPVVERFRQQTVKHALELVFVTPDTQALRESFAHGEEFAAIKIVQGSIDALPHARALGVQASTADYVFIGETHSYPHPRLAETLMQHFTGEWAIVMPAMSNGNPKTAVSWSGLLADYGRWAQGLPAGEITGIPIYNAAFYRKSLLALGGRLASAIGRGEELADAFRQAGWKCYFEPSVSMDHLNVSPIGHFLLQRFVLGMMIGGNRSRDWPLRRRLAYIAGGPLIPLVLWKRMLPGVRTSYRLCRWPAATLFWIALGLSVKTCGEVLAYLGVPWESAQRCNHVYEIHKLAYTDLK